MFHIVVRRTPGTWDALLGLVERHELPLITSENRPDGVAPGRWCRYVLARRFASGRAVAEQVAAALDGEAAAMVMIDELAAGGRLVPVIADAARRLRLERPDLAGRWGAFVSGGPRVAYTAFNPARSPAIDELLRAQATLCLELYPRYADYCAAGTDASARDGWMADFFQGGAGAFPQPRLRWLVARRRELGSGSRLTIMFPTTDVAPVDYLGRVEADVFLDRMLFVWVTRTAFRALILADNGGAGTYKWDERVSDPERDARFVESWGHYCREGSTASLRGPPACGRGAG